MAKIRIQKIIADSGYCSRRSAERLIEEGRVTLDGEKITTLGFRCEEDSDIRIDGEPLPIKRNTFTYLALNKPLGYVSTLYDPQGRKTIKDLIPSSYGRLFPVGRLDQNSSGLIIMTDDGEFANLVTHPSSAPEKEYIVTCRNPFIGDEIEKIRRGIYIREDGYTTAPATAQLVREDDDSFVMTIILHEGKKREIRHMMESIDHPVISLTRIRIGPINLDDLRRGEYYEISRSLIRDMREECLRRKKVGSHADTI